MENIFEPILDKDEKVIKTFKPHKGKMFLSFFLSWFFVWVWIVFAALGALLSDYDGNYNPDNWGLAIGVAVSVAIVCIGLNVLFFVLCYKNTYYAYTNKRVIIRKGIIGVDYKSLDMSMIGAVTVNVSILDKIVHKNTGSIGFGSMASPIGGESGHMFRFMHITNPYETYKEIKNVIDEHKNSKKD